FSDSPYDDLLFYDKSAGVGEFYRFDANTGMTQFSVHNNWRRSWQQIVPGQFLQNAAFDGLLFYEEGTVVTEFDSTDGHGNHSRIDITPGHEWRLLWSTFLAGEFTPNLVLSGTSRLCSYDASDGPIR